MLRYVLHVCAGTALVLVAACGSVAVEGAGQAEPPPQLGGAELQDDQLTWMFVNGAECRDSSPAGVAIRFSALSDGLLIFLGGGPICVDAQTCAAWSGAPLSVEAREQPRYGVFADQPENPFADWNQVWVPNCTDDYHVGSARDVAIPGLDGTQQFVGHANMALFLSLIKSKFDNIRRVVLGGSSSGGQGVIANLPQVQHAFGDETRMTLFIDSGPPVPSSETTEILPAMVELWGADQTMLSECGEACGDPADFFVDYFSWLVDTYGDDIDIALSAYMNDHVETREFGITEDAWVAHLETMRSETLNGPRSSTFYVDSRGHTLTRAMYTTKVGELTLAEWLDLVLSGEAEHVGP